MSHLVNPEKLWPSAQTVLGFISEIFGKPEPVPKKRIIPITEGTFDLGDGGKLKVIETIGHASHNLSFYESFNGGVFPGDAAGTYIPQFDEVIPTAPPPFYLDSALASLDKIISLNPTVLYYSHFGKVSNAVQRLDNYKKQLKLWGKIVQEGVEENQSFEEIRVRILQEDMVMSKLAPFLSSHPIYSVTALGNTIQGFIDNAKRIKAKEDS
jgi:glyoxylase-like metal-dependent hydrolase (beta-lactamase superfamily II)